MNEMVIDVAPVERWRRAMKACGAREPVWVWAEGSFQLELFDTGETDLRGKARLTYAFYDVRMGGQPIFEGDDIGGSPLDVIDSGAMVAGFLTFLSLQPGDTDAEYFSGYSDRQKEWMESYADELALCVIELTEEGEE